MNKWFDNTMMKEYQQSGPMNGRRHTLLNYIFVFQVLTSAVLDKKAVEGSPINDD